MRGAQMRLRGGAAGTCPSQNTRAYLRDLRACTDLARLRMYGKTSHDAAHQRTAGSPGTRVLQLGRIPVTKKPLADPQPRLQTRYLSLHVRGVCAPDARVRTASVH